MQVGHSPPVSFARETLKMQKVITADPNSAEAAQAKALIEQLKKG